MHLRLCLSVSVSFECYFSLNLPPQAKNRERRSLISSSQDQVPKSVSTAAVPLLGAKPVGEEDEEREEDAVEDLKEDSRCPATAPSNLGLSFYENDRQTPSTSPLVRRDEMTKDQLVGQTSTQVTEDNLLAGKQRANCLGGELTDSVADVLC